MSIYRLPSLEKDKNTLTQTKHSIRYIESVAGFLTNVSCEAGRNDMGCMSAVLSELSNGLCEAADDLGTFARWQEKQLLKGE